MIGSLTVQVFHIRCTRLIGNAILHVEPLSITQSQLHVHLLVFREFPEGVHQVGSISLSPRFSYLLDLL